MKKKIIVFICFLLSVIMVFSSCKQVDENNDEQQQNGTAVTDNKDAVGQNLILPYSQSDSLNPFFAVGVENISLADLSYESLYKVKSDYTPEACLAANGDIAKNSVTVTLNQATFSDGSSLSAGDVVYSFNKAKNSAHYAAGLSNVTSAKASGQNVIFTLAQPDPYALNILCFPVVKSGTAEKADSVPTGSGPYVYSDGGFTKNQHYDGQLNIQQVTLYNIVDFAYAENALEISNVNFLFEDLSDSTYRHVSVDSTTVGMNNLVFLGINDTNGVLSSSAVRTALYYAINKDDISSSSYQGYAVSAPLLFNPAFSELTAVSGIESNSNSDMQKAKAILTKTGYNKYAKDGSLTNGTASLKISLLVNSENSFRVTAANNIAESLRNIGFTVTVDSVPLDKYNQKISAGDFQLYLGEIKLTDNMDFRQFFTESGSASKGIDKTLRVCSDYTSFCEGSISLCDFIDSFMNDMPFVPVCYRSGFAAYKKGIKPDFSYSSSNLYAGISRWAVN